jgi:hypothetical protein
MRERRKTGIMTLLHKLFRLPILPLCRAERKDRLTVILCSCTCRLRSKTCLFALAIGEKGIINGMSLIRICNLWSHTMRFHQSYRTVGLVIYIKLWNPIERTSSRPIVPNKPSFRWCSSGVLVTGGHPTKCFIVRRIGSVGRYNGTESKTFNEGQNHEQIPQKECES